MKLVTEPWSEIPKALNSSASRTVVSAYLGSGGEQLLPLKEGDFLLVDASPANVRAGLTDPRVLLRFLKCKVRCFHFRGLHAKAYVADTSVFIGSANASSHSQHHYTELCLRVKSAALAARVRAWAEALKSEELKEARLKALCKIYKPPRFPRKRRSIKLSPSAGDRLRRLWIVSIHGEDNVTETPEMKTDEAHATTLLKPQRRYETEWYSCEGKNPPRLWKDAKPGDQLVVIDHEDHTRVFGPMRVLSRKQYIVNRRSYRRVYVEWDSLEKGVPFGKFRAAMRSRGMRLRASGTAQRLIGNQRVAAALREYLEAHT